MDKIRNYLAKEKKLMNKKHVEVWILLTTYGMYCNFYGSCKCFHFCFYFYRNYELFVQELQKYNLIIKKKKKKHNKTVLLAKSKLNSIEVLILRF